LHCSKDRIDHGAFAATVGPGQEGDPAKVKRPFRAERLEILNLEFFDAHRQFCDQTICKLQNLYDFSGVKPQIWPC
jgi:hypothetical protein